MSQERAMIFKEQQRKNIDGQVKKFDEEKTADFLRLRMTAMGVAEDTMHRAVAERDEPLSNSACGPKRREIALASQDMKRTEETYIRESLLHG
jgi:hypothetical protein